MCNVYNKYKVQQNRSNSIEKVSIHRVNEPDKMKRRVGTKTPIFD